MTDYHGLSGKFVVKRLWLITACWLITVFCVLKKPEATRVSIVGNSTNTSTPIRSMWLFTLRWVSPHLTSVFCGVYLRMDETKQCRPYRLDTRCKWSIALIITYGDCGSLFTKLLGNVITKIIIPVVKMPNLSAMNLRLLLQSLSYYVRPSSLLSFFSQFCLEFDIESYLKYGENIEVGQRDCSDATRIKFQFVLKFERVMVLQGDANCYLVKHVLFIINNL